MIELHGNATYARCLDCGARFELAPLREAFELEERLPVCDACAGIVKSATISFGQAMPEQEMARAEAESRACDLFLVIGSSLVVYPAAGFPVIAAENGAQHPRRDRADSVSYLNSPQATLTPRRPGSRQGRPTPGIASFRQDEYPSGSACFTPLRSRQVAVS